MEYFSFVAFPPLMCLSDLFVSGYNTALKNALPKVLYNNMSLQGVDYSALPEYATQQVPLNEGSYSLYSLLEYLNTCIVDEEPIKALLPMIVLCLFFPS